MISTQVKLPRQDRLQHLTSAFPFLSPLALYFLLDRPLNIPMSILPTPSRFMSMPVPTEPSHFTKTKVQTTTTKVDSLPPSLSALTMLPILSSLASVKVLSPVCCSSDVSVWSLWMAQRFAHLTQTVAMASWWTTMVERKVLTFETSIIVISSSRGHTKVGNRLMMPALLIVDASN